VGTDAASHFAGKRHEERRGVDLRVELIGGGATLQGRASDLSPTGVGVRLSERTLQGFRDVTDAVSAFHVLERHFTSGLVVRFPIQGDIRVSARVVRFVAPPRPGGDLGLGLKFVRPLAPDEWTRLTEQRKATPVPALAALKPGPRVQAVVFDDLQGPRCLLHVLRGASHFLEGAVESARPMTVEDVRAALGVSSLPVRVTAGEDAPWTGVAMTRDVRASETEGLLVVFETQTALPPSFTRRLGKPR
jgi:hypothetical protein